MKQITLRIPEDTLESLDDEASELDRTRSEHIRDVVKSRHEADELRTEHEKEIGELRDRLDERQNEIDELEAELDSRDKRIAELEQELTVSDIEERIADLEERVDELEGRADFDITQSGLSDEPEPASATRQTGTEPTTELVASSQTPDLNDDVDVGSTDPIEDALAGWSYGRGDAEQETNDSLARSSLEWLRDEAEGTIRRSDVPLDELAEDDPQERDPDTLWRSVIRGAWQHAIGQGYIEKIDSRGYEWSGPTSSKSF